MYILICLNPDRTDNIQLIHDQHINRRKVVYRMKRVLSRILAIAIAIVLFSAPSTAQAASSSLTLVRNDSGVKIYQWLPDPFHITQGNYNTLADFTTSDWKWHVPANKSFNFWFNFTQACNYTYIVNVNGETYIYKSVVGSNGTEFTIPASSTDSIVYVLVIADSGNVYQDAYYGIIN